MPQTVLFVCYNHDREYYALLVPFILNGKTATSPAYGNSVVLNPKWKLTLFQQESWEEGSVEQYRTQCCQAYLDNYHTRSTMMSTVVDSLKWPWDVLRWDDEESSDDDDHVQRAARSREAEAYNEFDHYIMLPTNN